MISVICPFNNYKILRDCLLKSIENQDEYFETILVDSKQYGFKSAADAINYGCNKAKGDYLLIVHQDIVFESRDVLSKLLELCNGLEFGVVGVAGIEEKTKKMFTKIIHGDDRIKAGNDSFTKAMSALSLDECLLLIKREIFERYSFSNIGNTWHLYGTDYVLTTRKNGLKAFIVPLDDVWHKSDGKSLSDDYFDAIQQLAKSNREHKVIYTCFGFWPTNPTLLSLKCKYRRIRFKKRGL